MAINKELNDDELDLETLSTAVGGVKAEDLPDKFKTGPAFRESMQNRTTEPEQPDKEDEINLNTVYGGPIRPEDLPEGYYTNKDNIKH